MPAKNRIALLFFMSLLLVLLFPSCESDKNTQTTPSFLEINKLEVGVNPSMTQDDEGFLTSDIKSVLVFALNKKLNKQENIGAFQLPCRIPILLEGNTEITLRPVIMQDRNIQTQTTYPFYERITLKDIPLQAGEITSLKESLLTKYDASSSQIAWYENFENPSIGFNDTNIRKTEEYVKSGYYSGHISYSTSDTLILYSNSTFTVYSNQTSLGLYLEMDYWTEDILYIGLRSKTPSGTIGTYWHYLQVPTIKDGSSPSDPTSWKKIYVTLSSIWKSYFDQYKDFEIAFIAIKKGESRYPGVYLDNIKLIHSK